MSRFPPPPVPRWTQAVYRALLPDGYSEDFLDDLGRDASRRGMDTHWARHLWHLLQLLSPSTLNLVWRLRRLEGRGPSGRSRRWTPDGLHAVRSLRRDPFFTAAAVGSLALGIGATVAVLSVANAVLLRPPPYQDPDQLVFVWNRLDGFQSDRLPLSGASVAELRRETVVFQDVAGIWATTRTVTLDERATLVPSATVTPNFLRLLGIEPLHGPGFAEDEGDDGSTAIMVSHGFWEQELGGDVGVIGRPLRLEGAPATVVGVLPAEARLLFPEAVGVPPTVDLFTVFPWAAAMDTEGPRFLRTVARLREGADLATADKAAGEVSDRLRKTYPYMETAGDRFYAVPLRSDSVQWVRPLLLALVCGAVVFLLLTCVNVASLLMARRAARAAELKLRRCLGATGGDLLRLTLMEVTVLLVAGSALGILVASLGLDALWQLRPASLTGIDDVALDPLAALGAVGSVFLLSALAVLGPFLGSWKPRDGQALGPRRTVGTRSMLPRRLVVVAELSLSVVLVAGAVLLGGSLSRMKAVDLGFSPHQVATFRVGISNRSFPEDAERARLADEVREAILAIPGVGAVGATSHIPLANWANWAAFAPPTSAPEDETGHYRFDHRSITPGYFEAVGASLIEGRSFADFDTGDAHPVVMVDDAYAARVFPGAASVTGRQVVATRYVDRQFLPVVATIVGVVGGMRDHDPALPPAGQVFWPFAQSARWELTFAARLDGAVHDWPELVRRTVARVHGDLAVADIRPLTSFVGEAFAPLRFAALLGTIFSLLAMVLAGLGLYSVVAYSTRQRVGEIGIRLALGARGRNVFGGVLKEGGAIAVAGVAMGLVGAAFATRFLDSLLFGVDPLDPRMLAAVAAGLFVVSATATVVPALRAARLDPATSLRRR